MSMAAPGHAFAFSFGPPVSFPEDVPHSPSILSDNHPSPNEQTEHTGTSTIVPPLTTITLTALRLASSSVREAEQGGLSIARPSSSIRIGRIPPDVTVRHRAFRPASPNSGKEWRAPEMCRSSLSSSTPLCDAPWDRRLWTGRDHVHHRGARRRSP